ncbi:putative ribosomally synthesized peptide with SipW-like signal peptide [Paenibacillus endophyticus]|uniref:Putative ribosomally synthesized peptide with SipW-like signal peptide n=1 Tax=Paenibacillus endophyticus TaxID=1294268 RepID=A0A7W5GDJ8_9BACL|nr:zf-HC2 domain-containing protein [Paenibacillus endophyticus]MBB3155980.1 putative ribosomally synthesized peptide with SipW-like signal peptide [Paenibacillus endophyticus]
MRDEHIAQDRMILYVKDKLTGVERSEAERHLAGCDLCLQLLMDAIAWSEEEELSASFAENSSSRLILPDMALLEQRVVGQLMEELRQEAVASKRHVSESKLEKAPRLRTWLQHPITHYTIAASITLLLLISGTFASFSQKLVQHDLNENRQPIVEPKPDEDDNKYSESWSDQIVNQTGSWLDSLKATRFKP